VSIVVVLFFFQFSPLFLFNSVPILVKMNQFCPFQIDTEFNIFYKNYTNIFLKLTFLLIIF